MALTLQECKDKISLQKYNCYFIMAIHRRRQEEVIEIMDEAAELYMQSHKEEVVKDKWVSIKDSLPSENGYYITWWINPEESGLIHYHIDGGWGNGFYTERVTHWMPLPKLDYNP